jgi:hypothetical protein
MIPPPRQAVKPVCDVGRRARTIGVVRVCTASGREDVPMAPLPAARYARRAIPKPGGEGESQSLSVDRDRMSGSQCIEWRPLPLSWRELPRTAESRCKRLKRADGVRHG